MNLPPLPFDLSKMIVAASVLGLQVPLPEDDWPQTIGWNGKTWTKDRLIVVPKTGDVQCALYLSGEEDQQDHLVIYNE